MAGPCNQKFRREEPSAKSNKQTKSPGEGRVPAPEQINKKEG